MLNNFSVDAEVVKICSNSVKFTGDGAGGVVGAEHGARDAALLVEDLVDGVGGDLADSDMYGPDAKIASLSGSEMTEDGEEAAEEMDLATKIAMKFVKFKQKFSK